MSEEQLSSFPYWSIGWCYLESWASHLYESFLRNNQIKILQEDQEHTFLITESCIIIESWYSNWNIDEYQVLDRKKYRRICRWYNSQK